MNLLCKTTVKEHKIVLKRKCKQLKMYKTINLIYDKEMQIKITDSLSNRQNISRVIVQLW